MTATANRPTERGICDALHIDPDSGVVRVPLVRANLSLSASMETDWFASSSLRLPIALVFVCTLFAMSSLYVSSLSLSLIVSPLFCCFLSCIHLCFSCAVHRHSALHFYSSPDILLSYPMYSTKALLSYLKRKEVAQLKSIIIYVLFKVCRFLVD